MSEKPANSELNVTFTKTPEGATRVDAMLGDQSVSGLWIIPFMIRIGAASVRMDGIGGVETPDEFRHRGYSRRALDASVEWMKAGDGALGMLYGIRNFYPKYGFATAGPSHSVRMDPSDQRAASMDGWTIRPVSEADLPAIRRIYDAATAEASGPAIRGADGGAWSALAASSSPDNDDECRVAVDRSGAIRAYAWRGRKCWPAESWERHEPEALIVAEAMATDPASADAILEGCLEWAREETATKSGPAKTLILSLPPETRVAKAAMLKSARFDADYRFCGESMARVSSVPRLLRSLAPELERRLTAARRDFSGTLRIETDMGGATLAVGADSLTVSDSAPSEGGPGANLAAHLPQTALARLALGAFPPDDLLDRLETPPDDAARELLETLFPSRHPHMYLPDRY